MWDLMGSEFSAFLMPNTVCLATTVKIVLRYASHLLCDVFKSTGVVRVHLKLLIRCATDVIKRHLGTVLVSDKK